MGYKFNAFTSKLDLVNSSLWTRTGTLLSPKTAGDGIDVDGHSYINNILDMGQDPSLGGLTSMPIGFNVDDGFGTPETAYMFGLSSSFFTSGQPGFAFQVGGSIRFTLSTDGMEYIPDLAGDSYRFGAQASAVGAGCDVTYNAGDAPSFGNLKGGDIYLDAGLPSGTGEHGIVIIKKEKEATALLPTQPSNTFRFISSFWNTGTGVADNKYMTLRAEPISSWYDSAYFYMNADGDDVFAIGKGDFIGVTPFDNGDGTFRFSYGCEYQSTAGVNAPDVNLVGGSCSDGTPGELRYIPGVDVASGAVANVVIGTDVYGDKDYKFVFRSSLAEGTFTWNNGNATLEFDSGMIIETNAVGTSPLTLKGASGQTAKLLDITDSADTSLTWITANGRLQTDIGIRTSAIEWGTSIDCFANGATTTLKSGSATGSYDLTGNAKGESVFIDTTNSQFASTDVGKYLIIQSGTYIGAKAVITGYIDADTVTVWGAGWDGDLTNESYKTVLLPTIAVGDDNNILLNSGTGGDLLYTSDLATGWTSSDNTDSWFKTQFLANEANIDHMRWEIDANGNGNVDGLQIDYKTGAISGTDSSQVLQISMNDRLATGGHYNLIDLETTGVCASCEKDAIHVGVGFDDALVVSGATADDPDYGYENTSGTSTDRVNSGGAGNDAFVNSAVNETLFESDNDYILIGSDDMFEVISAIITTEASKNIIPTFYYSKAGGNWTALTVDDATQGFQNSGLINWEAPADWTKDDEDLDGNAITNAYYVAIQRTVGGTIPTLPVESYFKTYAEQGGDTGMRIRGNGVVKLPYLTGAPASMENGDMWMESDGLHIYYGGAEKTVAGA